MDEWGSAQPMKGSARPFARLLSDDLSIGEAAPVQTAYSVLC